MGMKVELPTVLAQVRNDLCSRQAPHWSECDTCMGPGLPCAEDELDPKLIDDLLEDEDRGSPAFRSFLEGMKCDRCLLVLALKGVDKVMPGPQGVDWLHSPNADLQGQTPMQVFESRKFRPVIDALWLTNPESDAG